MHRHPYVVSVALWTLGWAVSGWLYGFDTVDVEIVVYVVGGIAFTLIFGTLLDDAEAK